MSGRCPWYEARFLSWRLDARLIDRLLLQLVCHPGRHAVRRVHHVGVGDDVTAAVDEPAGARLDVRSRSDRTGPRPQFKVTSPRTSVVINTTAGLTRRMAS